MVLSNSHSDKVLTVAKALLIDHNPATGTELSLRKVLGELQAEAVCVLHRIQFLIKYRELLVTDAQAISARLDTKADAPVA